MVPTLVHDPGFLRYLLIPQCATLTGENVLGSGLEAPLSAALSASPRSHVALCGRMETLLRVRVGKL